MFINVSNHPSCKWDVEQINEATHYGEIIDLEFPVIPAEADEDRIGCMAADFYEKIMDLLDHKKESSSNGIRDAVMLQGEFTFTFALVNKLKDKGITVLSACSDRKVVEKPDDNNNRIKEVRFQFVRFRRY